MRAASVVVHLALALVYLIPAFFLEELVSLTSAAGAGALSTAGAWMGLLALAFRAWFFAQSMTYLATAMHLAWPGRLRSFAMRETSYRNGSVADLCLRNPFFPAVFVVVLGLGVHGFQSSLVTGTAILALFLILETRVFKNKAPWQRLPALLGAPVVFVLLLVSLVFIGSASLAQAVQRLHLLRGEAQPTPVTAFLDVLLLSDFHLLLVFASGVIIFLLPSLHPLGQKPATGKTIAASLMLLAWAVYQCVPAATTAARHWLVQKFSEGTREVTIGTEGWLFDMRELRALTGSGPVRPDLSTRDSSTSQVKEAVLAFAQQARDHGAALLLVPLPMKASIYPEAIGRGDPETPLYHPDQRALYAELAKGGVDVLDLTDAFMKLKATHKLVFFKRDSHWTPEAMQEAARVIAAHVRKQHPGTVPADPLIVDTQAPDASGFGDLAARLYPRPERVLGEESSVLVSFPGISNDLLSPISLLGDGSVRIYDDPALGYAAKPDTHASLAQHLALYLGTRIDTIAVNSGTSTAVRRAYNQRPEDQLRGKKLVIWLLPARELVASPSAGVEW